VVLEILEVVEPDAEVLTRARNLVAKRYRLAFDGFVYDARFHELLNIAENHAIAAAYLEALAWTWKTVDTGL
jgi:c-di-GMP-related signal transduction protein